MASCLGTLYDHAHIEIYSMMTLNKDNLGPACALSYDIIFLKDTMSEKISVIDHQHKKCSRYMETKL